jgi:hypothetical protein
LRFSIVAGDTRGLVELLDYPAILAQVDHDHELFTGARIFTRSAYKLTEFFGSFDAVPRRDRLVLQDFVEDGRSLREMLLSGFSGCFPTTDATFPFGFDGV